MMDAAEPGRWTFLRSLSSALFGVLLVMGAQSIAWHVPITPATTVSDYRVYACGERAMLRGADPYRTEPLRACEHRVALERGEPAWAVTPFCLPPYAAALLAPFGVLPFALGRDLWFVLLVLATAIAAAAIARTIGRSGLPVALALGGVLGTLNVMYGETVAFAIAAVALAGLACQRNRPIPAGIACAAALIEPAIGLPAVLGLFLLRPTSRVSLIVCGAILAIVGLSALGFAENLEYLTQFLPAHQHAEFLANDQFSFTHLAYVLGASAHAASVLGSVSYVVAIGVGIYAAYRISEATGLGSLVVLLPLGISMLGSPFVHDVEITSALPAALVLGSVSRRARVAFVVLVAGLSLRLPGAYIPIVASVVGSVALFAENRKIARALGYSAAAVALTFLFAHAVPKVRTEVPLASFAVPARQVAAESFSSNPWEQRIAYDGAMRSVDPGFLFRELPVWLALASLPFALPLRRRSEGEVKSGFSRAFRRGVVASGIGAGPSYPPG